MQKPSPAQVRQLTRIARLITSGKYANVTHNGRDTTAKALAARNLVELVAVEKPTYGHVADVVITDAGWDWLEANTEIVRPVAEQPVKAPKNLRPDWKSAIATRSDGVPPTVPVRLSDKKLLIRKLAHLAEMYDDTAMIIRTNAAGATGEGAEVAREIAADLATMFARDNGRFDRSRFMDACGFGDPNGN
jgi:hypothetical protein